MKSYEEIRDPDTVLLDGEEISFNAAVALMDDDIREELHRELAPCGNQEFLDAYVKAHHDKYGEDFIVN